MPMLVMVEPKPPVTVETTWDRGMLLESTPISTAEMISAGHACIRVKMIRIIITTIPINIANTGFI